MDHIERTIETLVERIGQQEAEVIKTKSAVNSLCVVLGRAAMYIDLEPSRPLSLGSLSDDEFYGQPLSKVVRSILAARESTKNRSATVNEIYDAMIEGGFKFDAANDDNARRSLRISLSKNSQTFHKLPNGKYGLKEWYPNAKDAKPKAANGADDADGEEANGEFDFKEKEEAADVSA